MSFGSAMRTISDQIIKVRSQKSENTDETAISVSVLPWCLSDRICHLSHPSLNRCPSLLLSHLPCVDVGLNTLAIAS